MKYLLYKLLVLSVKLHFIAYPIYTLVMQYLMHYNLICRVSAVDVTATWRTHDRCWTKSTMKYKNTWQVRTTNLLILSSSALPFSPYWFCQYMIAAFWCSDDCLSQMIDDVLILFHMWLITSRWGDDCPFHLKWW